MPLSRVKFIARVKKALRPWRVTYHPRPTQEEYEKARRVDPGEDIVAYFVSMATDAGMTVHRPEGDWGEDLGALLEERGCGRILCDAWESLRGAPSWENLKERFQWVQWDACDDSREESFHADCGVTSVQYALAETGSLVLFASSEQSRLASLVPPLHVALVPQKQILPDMMDLFPLLDSTSQETLPSQLILITGPSKTSDIEMTLVKGVHGPLEVHVFLI